MGYQPGAPGSFFVSREGASGQVEDGVECSREIARFRSSACPDPGEHCLVW